MNCADLVELARMLVPLSFASVGGGASIIADLHREAISVHGWMTEAEFAHAFAISRMAPGPGALLVTLIGWEVAGVAGAIVATLAIFLPASLMVGGIAMISTVYRGSVFLQALEIGLRPVAAGLILAATTVLLRAAPGGWLGWLTAFGAAALLMQTRINPLLVVIAGAAVFLAWDALRSVILSQP